jgi:uncharacterized protein YjbJ (UPF0337 family)
MWTMNWDEIAGTWKQFRGKVKEKVGTLTNDDLMAAAGRREQSAGKIQQNYGSAKAQSKKRFGASAPVLIPVRSSTPPRNVPGDRR